MLHAGAENLFVNTLQNKCNNKMELNKNWLSIRNICFYQKSTYTHASNSLVHMSSRVRSCIQTDICKIKIESAQFFNKIQMNKRICEKQYWMKLTLGHARTLW